VGTNALAFTERIADVVQQHQHSEAENIGTNGDDQVPEVPTSAFAVGVVAAGHTFQPEEVHGEERCVEPDKHGPEVYFTERLVHDAAGDLGEPVVDSADQ